MRPSEPQLMMKRQELNRLPDLAMPAGYSLRHFTEGDGVYWEEIIATSFQSQHNFQKEMAEQDSFMEERVWFICYKNRPVATATAWEKEEFRGEGYLHMVGAKPEHTGKGLGLQVSLAALHHMVTEKKRTAVLHTDDFRVAAIKTYLKLGFKPTFVHESHQQRWQDLFKRLGYKDIDR